MLEKKEKRNKQLPFSNGDDNETNFPQSLHSPPQGGVWKFFLIGQNRSTNQRSGMILEVQIQNFGAHACCARQRTRVKVLIFQKVYPQKSAFFVFEEKHPKKKFSLCFGSDSALKTINTQLLFCSVFLKTHQKKLLTAKNAILAIFEN